MMRARERKRERGKERKRERKKERERERCSRHCSLKEIIDIERLVVYEYMLSLIKLPLDMYTLSLVYMTNMNMHAIIPCLRVPPIYTPTIIALSSKSFLHILLYTLLRRGWHENPFIWIFPQCLDQTIMAKEHEDESKLYYYLQGIRCVKGTHCKHL